MPSYRQLILIALLTTVVALAAWFGNVPAVVPGRSQETKR